MSLKRFVSAASLRKHCSLFSASCLVLMSLPTPLYKLNAVQQQSVYEPSEDTFLLLDAIEKDIEKLRDSSPEIILEIGCGSGVVSVFLNKALGGGVTSLATDYNPDALDCTLETGRLNDVKIEVVRTDLDNGLSHLENKVDVLLFNPPYVPTKEKPKDNAERCWAGGPTGRDANEWFCNDGTTLIRSYQKQIMQIFIYSSCCLESVNCCRVKEYSI
ncbi:hypothetical protein Q1695_005952 [Nippostrongylus brasiliensis]|nr:hypothetical protein Q1695_005952 [Nippostrongylus brasiliensis]